MKTSVRVRSFLKDEQDLIYRFSTQNRLFPANPSSSISYGDYGEFQSFVYKYVRCAQTHDAALDTSKVTLGGEFGIGRCIIEGVSIESPPGTILISRATVLSLIFAVVCAIENERLDLSNIAIPFYTVPSMQLAPFVGKRDKFIQKIHELFP